MKRIELLCVALLLFSVNIWGQNRAVTLDEALSNSTVYLKQRIPAGSKVIVLNFVSNSSDLSDYIIEELTAYIVNDGVLTVVDRRNLEAIRQEMNFQLSGEVSDETAQSIGQKLGAQTMIAGSISAIGATYRLRIRAIEVETAAIQGMYNVTVAQDSTIAALTGTAYAIPTTPILPNQNALYGTWTRGNDTSYKFSSSTVEANFTANSDYSGFSSFRRIVQISSWEAVTNIGSNRSAYPSGFRIKGTTISSTDSRSPVGSTYDRTWYISTDGQRIISLDLDSSYVWNKN